MPDEVTESVQDEASASEKEPLQKEAEAPLELDETGQKIYGLVQEVADLFQKRIANGELTPYEVAEALSITLTGTIYSTVPKEVQKTVMREADSLNKKLLKTFDHQVQKKNYMFAAQLLGATKSASYIVSHGNNIITRVRQQAAEEAAKKAEGQVSEE